MAATHDAPLTVADVLPKDATAWSWLSNRGIVKLNLMLVLFQISSYATGYDGSMMNGLQTLDEWKNSFNDPRPEDLALLNAIQNVGQLVALPFCAIACDRYGRRPVLVASAAVLILGTALQAAAQSVGMFIGARGVIGFGLAFNITAAPLLLLELAYPKQQGPVVGIYNSLWGLGALSAAWITYGTFRIPNTWAWRIPSLLQAASSVVQIGLCWLAEESPRWLVSKERDAEARAILVKYHANGDESDPLVNIEMEEIRTALRLEAEALKTSSYMSFFQTKGNRQRFFVILAVAFFSQWSGNGLISYYLGIVLSSIGYESQDQQTLINAILTIWGLVWSLLFSFLANRFKRRTLFLASTIGCLLVYVTWTALQATYDQAADPETGVGPESLSQGILAMIFLFGFMFSIGWSPLQVVYVMEILPYNLRARGLVLYNFFVALALIFNQYANPIGVTNSGWKYYIFYDVWIAFEVVVVYFLFPETGNMSVEETAALLDGDEYNTKLADGVAAATGLGGYKADASVDVKPAPSKEG